MDIPADVVIEKIREFAAAESSSRLLALAISSHGDGHDNMLFVERAFTANDMIRELDGERESPPEVSMSCKCSNTPATLHHVSNGSLIISTKKLLHHHWSGLRYGIDCSS